MYLDRDITTVEGNWQIGKSTLLRSLSGYGYGLIPEPLHTDAIKEQFDLDEWYATMHLVNIELASRKSGPQVIERTVASDLAFMRTINQGSRTSEAKISQIVKTCQRSGLLERIGEIVFLRVDSAAYMSRRAPEIQDKGIAGVLQDVNSPFEEYQHNLEYFISILFPHAAIADVMSYGKVGFNTREQILQQVDSQLRGTL